MKTKFVAITVVYNYGDRQEKRQMTRQKTLKTLERCVIVTVVAITATVKIALFALGLILGAIVRSIK